MRSQPLLPPTAPRRNQLLAALPDADYERLVPYLEPAPFPPGWTVHIAGDRETSLYFLTAGIVARSYVLENGSTAGFAVTGREGAIGVGSFLGGGSTPTQAVALSAGYAYRLGTDLLRAEFAELGALAQVLLHYVQALITQITLTAACNRHHSIERQMCRWILSCVDRLGSSELMLTQELLAEMLGVRRESVTSAAAGLQEAGLIHWRRGRIYVLDRAQLEARACECYQTIKREQGRLQLMPVRRSARLQPRQADNYALQP